MTRNLLIISVLCLFAGRVSPAVDRLEAAVQRGNEQHWSKIWHQVEKERTITVAHYPVLLKLTFVTPDDFIALASSEAHRRHQEVNRQAAEQTLAENVYKVRISGNTSSAFTGMLASWQAPQGHMTITANGTEIQPTAENFDSSSEQLGGFKASTFFTFHLPVNIQSMKVTLISAGGNEKAKDVDPKILE